MSRLTKAVALCGGLLVPGLFLCATAAAESAVLDSATQARIRAATFEVVMRKPAQDSLVYERVLPVELLPYTERTDQYVSMGTAFAIGDGRFVTAAHVLQPGFRSQYGQPALRGADGVVHQIDRIHKWASHQDFAVFSTQTALPTGHLGRVERACHVGIPQSERMLTLLPGQLLC